MNKRREMQRISNHFLPILTLIGLAAVGCAGQTPQAHDVRAAGEWTFRLPQTQSPYAGLAIGRGSSEPTALALVDDALASTPAPSRTQAPPKPRPAVPPRASLAANTKPAPAPQPAAEAPVAVPAQPEQLALNTPAVPSTDEELRYSERDQQSQKQRDFRGGDALVITASTLIIILLVVLLIVLLT